MGFIQDFQNFQVFGKWNKQRLPIGFYSEMGSDRIYFEEMIHRLVEEYKQPVLYLTSSDKDPMLAYAHPDFHTVNIGSGLFRNMAFRDLNVKLFVMTLPDLEAYELKRSINPVHYAYVFHSLVSTHMIYRDYAFDAYDTIFTVGPHHETEIREAERLFNLKPKAFVPHGYPRIDQILKDYEQYQKTVPARDLNEPVKVLIAPSWGPNSISSLCLEPLIQHLLNAGLDVTYRPHPMTHREDAPRMDNVQKRFGGNALFHFDADIANADSLFASDVMISDWSGVALEFALATGKPVLYIDIPRKLQNTRFEKFQSVPVEVSLREQLGAVVSPDAIDTVPARIAEIMGSLSERQQTIARLKTELVYNLGRSSEVGAAELMKLLESLPEN